MTRPLEALRLIASQLEREWEHGPECEAWAAVDTGGDLSVDDESRDCGVAGLYRLATEAVEP